MSSDIAFFIKFDEGFYLTDGWRIEVKAVDGFLIWASSSSGYYGQPCDKVHLGVIEAADEYQPGYTELEVRSLSVAIVSPVENGNVAEQLCFRQTLSYLEQCAQLDLLEPPMKNSGRLKVDWRKEGF